MIVDPAGRRSLRDGHPSGGADVTTGDHPPSDQEQEAALPNGRRPDGWVAPDLELVKQALAQLMDEVADELWFCDGDGNIALANKAAVAALGIGAIEDLIQPLDEFLGGLAIFDGPARPRLSQDAPLRRALKGEVITDYEEMVRHPRTGRMLYRAVYCSPIRDASGGIVGSVAVVRDVTERRESEERQKLLVAELQHRVKNILANVHAILGRLYARHGPSPDLLEALDVRIQALARTQEILTREGAQRATIAELLAAELAVVELGDVRVSGPTVWLDANAAQIVGMALHELTTNAAKHGVGRRGGALEVSWRLGATEVGGEAVRIDWVERLPEGEKLSPPRREGFGTELLTRAAPFSLAGKSSLEHPPGGVRWSLAFPLRKAAASTS